MESYANAPPPTAPGYPPEVGMTAPPQQYPPQTAMTAPPQPYPQQMAPPYPTEGAPAPYPTNPPQQAYPAQNPPQDYPSKGYGPPPGYPGPPASGYPGAPPSNYGYQPYGPPAGTSTTQGYPVQRYVPQTTTSHNTTTVITQQPAGAIMISSAPPPDNMAYSIVSMFCCFFIGIFALLKSLKSRELYRQGDFNGAQLMGMSARRLATIAIVIAVCFYVAIVIIRIAVNVATV